MSGLHLNERAPIVVLLTAVLLLPTVGVCFAQEDRGALMLVEVQLSGLTALRDCDLLVHFTFNNATVTKRVTVRQGDELNVASSIKASLSKPSVLQVQTISQDNLQVFSLKVLIDEGRARVVESYVDMTFLNPLDGRELVRVKLNAGMAKVVVELPLLLSGNEEVTAQVEGKNVDVEVSKGKTVTSLTFTTLVGVDKEPLFFIRILSRNLTLIEVLGKVSAKNSSSEVSVRGLVKTVHVKIMKGKGVLELSLPTSILQPLPLNDRGVLYEGLVMTIEPLVSVEKSREVKVVVLEKLTGRVLERPMLLAIYLPLHKTWLNMSTSSGATSVLLPPCEEATLYVFAEGFKEACLKIPQNASEVRVALENEGLAPLEMALRALEAVWSWLCNYWAVVIASCMGALIALLIVRRR